MSHQHNNVNDFSLAEEVWHAVTHGVGFFLSIAALVLLVTFAALEGSLLHILSATLYGISLVVMYGSSTLYHAITEQKIKGLFQKFDHAAKHMGTATIFFGAFMSGELSLPTTRCLKCRVSAKLWQ